MQSFSANAHANVKRILSNTFVIPKLFARPDGKMFIVNGRQFSFVQRFIKPRSSGKLIRERAIANLDRALRELIYLFFIFKQTRPTTHDPRPTTHDPRPTTHDPRPTTHDPPPTTHETPTHDPPTHAI